MIPYIICEIGSNWTDKRDCLDSIVQAKLAGANAVKFQFFTYKELYGVPQFTDQELNQTPHDMLERNYELSREWLPDLKARCDSFGVDFMCSAFSPDGYSIVNQFVKAHKIASAELSHVRILERVRDLGKPVFLSTGASGIADIKAAINILQGVPITLMYCVAAYPAREVDVRCIPAMKEMFGLPVGFSDHSTDYYNIPALAAGCGAVAIEKHFRLRDNMRTPDAGHSLNPEQFKTMVHCIRGEHKVRMHYLSEEHPMILKHNRRLIATKDIKAGDVLEEGRNFGIYRSKKDDTHGLNPFRITSVHGKTALKDIAQGAGIGPTDF